MVSFNLLPRHQKSQLEQAMVGIASCEEQKTIETSSSKPELLAMLRGRLSPDVVLVSRSQAQLCSARNESRRVQGQTACAQARTVNIVTAVARRDKKYRGFHNAYGGSGPAMHTPEASFRSGVAAWGVAPWIVVGLSLHHVLADQSNGTQAENASLKSLSISDELFGNASSELLRMVKLIEMKRQIRGRGDVIQQTSASDLQNQLIYEHLALNHAVALSAAKMQSSMFPGMSSSDVTVSSAAADDSHNGWRHRRIVHWGIIRHLKVFHRRKAAAVGYLNLEEKGQQSRTQATPGGDRLAKLAIVVPPVDLAVANSLSLTRCRQLAAALSLVRSVDLVVAISLETHQIHAAEGLLTAAQIAALQAEIASDTVPVPVDETSIDTYNAGFSGKALGDEEGGEALGNEEALGGEALGGEEGDKDAPSETNSEDDRPPARGKGKEWTPFQWRVCITQVRLGQGPLTEGYVASSYYAEQGIKLSQLRNSANSVFDSIALLHVNFGFKMRRQYSASMEMNAESASGAAHRSDIAVGQPLQGCLGQADESICAIKYVIRFERRGTNSISQQFPKPQVICSSFPVTITPSQDDVMSGKLLSRTHPQALLSLASDRNLSLPLRFSMIKTKTSDLYDKFDRKAAHLCTTQYLALIGVLKGTQYAYVYNIAGIPHIIGVRRLDVRGIRRIGKDNGKRKMRVRMPDQEGRCWTGVISGTSFGFHAFLDVFLVQNPAAYKQKAFRPLLIGEGVDNRVNTQMGHIGMVITRIGLDWQHWLAFRK
ncbi:uncharacterized protein MYCFIDRAFT_180067 [Pseudocercospora fijiensis CIRAD86]|uniref:Uncharacterized protein n=1 Tax=Pseudocercospora fijiensis (strain CIRAD86) TaxID=383855 RepID=M2YH85_PSEFD|nr:uncharacterized protein MYCFIDRAFT_180067 [Pseudocercospora fijiensis CIRAD86]EME77190.1 hypothetical protein MYCFIDRAFT_180067 [Pseudocercospora fijiensis CIRAD86]